MDHLEFSQLVSLATCILESSPTATHATRRALAKRHRKAHLVDASKRSKTSLEEGPIVYSVGYDDGTRAGRRVIPHQLLPVGVDPTLSPHRAYAYYLLLRAMSARGARASTVKYSVGGKTYVMSPHEAKRHANATWLDQVGINGRGSDEVDVASKADVAFDARSDGASLLALADRLLRKASGRRELALAWDFRHALEDVAVALHVTRLPWRLLPEGDLLGTLNDFVERETRRGMGDYDFGRLRAILKLRPAPSRCYVGLGEFTGYFAFCYPHTSKVVLECPIQGNALYVFDRDWESLSKLPKSRLLADHSDHCRRILHRTHWASALRAELANS